MVSQPNNIDLNQKSIISSFDNGTMNSVQWEIDNIRLSHTIVNYNELAQCHKFSNDTDLVRLHFGISGDYCFKYKQLDKSYDLKAGHHNIMYSKGFEIDTENKSLEIETFGINFTKESFISITQDSNDSLKRFTEKIIHGENAIISKDWGVIDLALKRILSEIIDCKYTGGLKKLFLISKSIELLVVQAEQINLTETISNKFIKSGAEIDKIIAAKDLIINFMQSPPTLSQIAKTVGLNEYKLKRGFKEVFNTTIFGYLADQRLELARKLLQDTDKTAYEISMDIGYSSPQHFSNAFKAKFGVPPKNIFK